jgi:RasGEF domain
MELPPSRLSEQEDDENANQHAKSLLTPPNSSRELDDTGGSSSSTSVSVVGERSDSSDSLGEQQSPSLNTAKSIASFSANSSSGSLDSSKVNSSAAISSDSTSDVELRYDDADVGVLVAASVDKLIEVVTQAVSGNENAQVFGVVHSYFVEHAALVRMLLEPLLVGADSAPESCRRGSVDESAARRKVRIVRVMNFLKGWLKCNYAYIVDADDGGRRVIGLLEHFAAKFLEQTGDEDVRRVGAILSALLERCSAAHKTRLQKLALEQEQAAALEASVERLHRVSVLSSVGGSGSIVLPPGLSLSSDGMPEPPPARAAACSPPPSPTMSSSAAAASLRSDNLMQRTIADWEVGLVALQLTHLEQRLFNRLDGSELLHGRFDDDARSPTLQKCIDHYNYVTAWVASEVLRRPTVDDRTRAIERFVELAEQLRDVKNYSSALQVISSLDSMMLGRLKQTWRLVSAAHCAKFASLRRFASADNDFEEYHVRLAASLRPMLPDIGVLLKDLRRAEALPTYVDGLVNWRKMLQLGRLLTVVQKSQEVPFEVPPNKQLQQWLMSRTILSEDEQFELSKRTDEEEAKSAAAAAAAASAPSDSDNDDASGSSLEASSPLSALGGGDMSSSALQIAVTVEQWTGGGSSGSGSSAADDGGPPVSSSPVSPGIASGAFGKLGNSRSISKLHAFASSVRDKDKDKDKEKPVSVSARLRRHHLRRTQSDSKAQLSQRKDLLRADIANEAAKQLSMGAKVANLDAVLASSSTTAAAAASNELLPPPLQVMPGAPEQLVVGVSKERYEAQLAAIESAMRSLGAACVDHDDAIARAVEARGQFSSDIDRILLTLDSADHQVQANEPLDIASIESLLSHLT